MENHLNELAGLIRKKNEADRAIAQLIQRPSTAGNIGEYVAATVFSNKLMTSGSHPGYDGVLPGRSDDRPDRER